MGLIKFSHSPFSLLCGISGLILFVFNFLFTLCPSFVCGISGLTSLLFSFLFCIVLYSLSDLNKSSSISDTN